MCNLNLLITSVLSRSVRPVFVPVALPSESNEEDAELAELASLGFSGCLSSVHFNSISPLKAALLHPDSPVSVTGPLAQSSCGSSSPANPHTAETAHSLPGTRSTLSSYLPYPPLYHKATSPPSRLSLPG